MPNEAEDIQPKAISNYLERLKQEQDELGNNRQQRWLQHKGQRHCG